MESTHRKNSTPVTPTVALALMRAADELFADHVLACDVPAGLVCFEHRRLENAALDAADLYVTAVDVAEVLEARR